MKTGDIVCLLIAKTPVIGEVVAFTPKRVRIAVRSNRGYTSLLRAKTTVSVLKKGKVLL